MTAARKEAFRNIEINKIKETGKNDKNSKNRNKDEDLGINLI